MADVLSFLATIELDSTNRYPMSDSRAWASDAKCPGCGSAQMVVLARQLKTQTGGTVETPTLWFRCPACYAGAVSEDGVVYPSVRPLRTPKGLPGEDLKIWEETRSCLGVGAYTAAVMLCRKLLFHVAVAKGLPAKDGGNRAPSYMQAVKHLEQEGVITSVMRSWVDGIKDVGNDANHEITPIDKESALDVATFTEQLLVLAYEMQALRARANPLAAETEDAGEPPAEA